MSKNIKIVIISVLCLLLATVLGLGGTYGYVTLKANNDVKMQEQYSAGYDSRADEIAELEKDRQDTADQNADLKANVNAMKQQVEKLQNDADDLAAIKNGEKAVVSFIANDKFCLDVQILNKNDYLTNPVDKHLLDIDYELLVNGEDIINELLQTPIPYSITIPVSFSYLGVATATTFTGLTNFDGNYVWTDGVDYYYSNGTTQYVLDITTHMWTEMVWNGLTSFNGNNVWTNGVDYYYTYRNQQFVLDVTTHTWTETWNWNIEVEGLTGLSGNSIFCLGDKYYYSILGLGYCELDLETHTVKQIGNLDEIAATNALMFFDDNCNWFCAISDGESYLCYTLDPATNTWGNAKPITIEALQLRVDEVHSPMNIWTDGVNQFYTDGSNQYVFDVGTKTWLPMRWENLTSFNGYNVWSDGVNCYYSKGAGHYVLTANRGQAA